MIHGIRPIRWRLLFLRIRLEANIPLQDISPPLVSLGAPRTDPSRLMATAAAARKRPVPDVACLESDGSKKRARHQLSTIDDYDKLKVLGFGSYGVVAKARDRRTGEAVAVKCFRGDGDGEPAAAGLREVACLAAFRGHPSVVQIKGVDADEATGDLFLVMEFVGSSLRRRLTRPFSENETRALMRQLLNAAEKLHGAGIIHRNLTPENILVSSDDTLKICGFGTAMTTAERAGLAQCVGTMQYCSPEQHIGMCRYTPAVDMWALGCVMAELLAGKPLFESDTEDDMFEEILYLRDQIVCVGLDAFDEYLPELSQAGREVLAGLLSFHDHERLTAAEALEHRWFAEDAKLPAFAVAEHPAVSE
ncbi:hypothetical protein ACP70R_029398 [Stipagrostis hirtigluma subsp. patula]